MVAGEEKSEWKSYWKKISTLFLAAVSVILCVLYSLNVISLYWLIREFIAALGIVFFLYVIRYVKFEKLSEKGRLTGNKVAYVVGGSSLGIFTFFGIAAILRIIGLPPLSYIIGLWPTIILLLVVSPCLGGYFGYWIGKKRGFQPPKIP